MKCYSSTTPYYTPVLLCTTLQYYSVLQSTTPVLLRTTPVLCTTKYQSSTTPCYKVLRQYYSVLQTITPVLLRTTSSRDSSSSSCTEDEEEATWKRLWVLMYTTRLNDTPKSLKRRKLKKRWETSNVGWHQGSIEVSTTAHMSDWVFMFFVVFSGLVVHVLHTCM